MCRYCNRENVNNLGKLPPLPYRDGVDNLKPCSPSITGNIIDPKSTTAYVYDYITTQPQLVVTDITAFEGTGIGCIYIPIRYCPECGRKLGLTPRRRVMRIWRKTRKKLKRVFRPKEKNNGK